MVNDAEGKVLKTNLNVLEYEIARLRSTVNIYEKKPAWLVSLLFFRPKNDLLAALRFRIRMMENDLTKLRYRVFLHEKKTINAKP